MHKILIVLKEAEAEAYELLVRDEWGCRSIRCSFYFVRFDFSPINAAAMTTDLTNVVSVAN